MKYEISMKDSECSPMVPGNSKLELGDIVSVTNRKNNTTHTFIVVDIDCQEVDICEECDLDRIGWCICYHEGDSRYDVRCAAPDGCMFRSIDKIMESL